MKRISKNITRFIGITLLMGLSGTVLAISTEANELSLSVSSHQGVDFSPVVQSLKHAQANPRPSSALRSKSEVMQEVKRRYNGQVVKITLNERTATYSVRVLLPTGKVKNLSVSARK